MKSESIISNEKIEGNPKLSDAITTWIVVAVLAVIDFLLYKFFIDPYMDNSFNGDLAPSASPGSFPLTKVFTFLFLMLGPFKIIGPYAAMTRSIEIPAARRIAILATVFAALALLFAAFLGKTILKKFGIPLPVLALSVGIILFLVALINIIQQFKPAVPQNDPPKPPFLNKAISFAFPTIITPYGIAAFIVFLALAPDQTQRIAIGAIAAVILIINLISMLITLYLSRFMGIILQLVAAVLGVIQVALGIQIIYNSLREILK